MPALADLPANSTWGPDPLPPAYAAIVDDLAQHLHEDHWGPHVDWHQQGEHTQRYWHSKARAALALPSLAALLDPLRYPSPPARSTEENDD